MSSFTSKAVVVPASVAVGAAVPVNPRSHVSLGLSGSFTATVQFEYSPLENGDVWFPIGSPLNAPGLRQLPAGQAQRVRASTTVHTTGTPTGSLLSDLALDKADYEREFSENSIAVPASVDVGAPLALPEGEQALFVLSGTFDATVQLQISLTDSGLDWHNWRAPLTAPGQVQVPKGLCRRIRANTTAFTSGAPVGNATSGFTAEPVEGDISTSAVAELSSIPLRIVWSPENPNGDSSGLFAATAAGFKGGYDACRAIRKRGIPSIEYYLDNQYSSVIDARGEPTTELPSSAAEPNGEWDFTGIPIGGGLSNAENLSQASNGVGVSITFADNCIIKSASDIWLSFTFGHIFSDSTVSSPLNPAPGWGICSTGNANAPRLTGNTSASALPMIVHPVGSPFNYICSAARDFGLGPERTPSPAPMLEMNGVFSIYDGGGSGRVADDAVVDSVGDGFLQFRGAVAFERRGNGVCTFPTLGEVGVGPDIAFTTWNAGLNALNVGPIEFARPPIALVTGDNTQMNHNQHRLFNPDATSGTVTSGNAETYALVDGQTLTVAVDGGGAATATFNTGDFVAIGAATAAEVATVLNTDVAGQTADGSSGSVVITSDTTGASSDVEVTGGTAAAAFAFPTGVQSGVADGRTVFMPQGNPASGTICKISNHGTTGSLTLETFGGAATGNIRNVGGADDSIDAAVIPPGMHAVFRCDGGSGLVPGVGAWIRESVSAIPVAFVRDATVVEDATLLASASATATNNNNVLAAVLSALRSHGIATLS